MIDFWRYKHCFERRNKYHGAAHFFKRSCTRRNKEYVSKPGPIHHSPSANYGLKLHKAKTICSWAGPTQRHCDKIAASSSSSRKTLSSCPPSLGFFLPDAPPPSRRSDSPLPAQVISGFRSVDPCGPLRTFSPPTIGTSKLVEIFFLVTLYMDLRTVFRSSE